MDHCYCNDLFKYAVENVNLAFDQLYQIVPKDDKGDRDGFLKQIIDNTDCITDDFIYDLALSAPLKQGLIDRMDERGLINVDYVGGYVDQKDFESLLKSFILDFNNKKLRETNWVTKPEKQDNQNCLKVMAKIIVDSIGIKNAVKMIVDIDASSDVF